MNKKEIENLVYNYETKSEHGFNNHEIESILLNFPDINMDKFWSAMTGNTCMVEDNMVVNYHCDIYKAIVCGIENRDLTPYEWD